MTPTSPAMLRRSMSGNNGLNALANSSSGILRRQDVTGSTNVGATGCTNTPAMANSAYRANLVSHFTEDLEFRRKVERNMEDGRSDSTSILPLFFLVLRGPPISYRN